MPKQIDPTEMKSFIVECAGYKVPIRTIPNPNGEIIGFIRSGEKITVHAKTVSGFYCLQDHSV